LKRAFGAVLILSSTLRKSPSKARSFREYAVYTGKYLRKPVSKVGLVFQCLRDYRKQTFESLTFDSDLQKKVSNVYAPFQRLTAERIERRIRARTRRYDGLLRKRSAVKRGQLTPLHTVTSNTLVVAQLQRKFNNKPA